jgi:hypothetical protein
MTMQTPVGASSWDAAAAIAHRPRVLNLQAAPVGSALCVSPWIRRSSHHHFQLTSSYSNVRLADSSVR